MPQDPKTLVQAAAIVSLVAAVFHLLFWRLFRWPHSLGEVGSVNRGTLYTMNWALIYFFGFMAYLLFRADPAVEGRNLLIGLLYGMSGFYLLRALVQPYFFRLKHWLSIAVFVVALAGAVIHYLAAAAVSGI
jgi:hypothetical protein